MSSPSPISKPEFDPQRVLAPIARALLAGCAAGVVGGFVVFAILSMEPSVEPVAFDSALWSANPYELRTSVERDRRRAMAPDLIERVLVPGTTRAQAHEWLGAPNRWTVLDTRPWFSKEDESWWLGEASVGDEWLVLDFDGGDRLLKAYVVNCCDAGD